MKMEHLAVDADCSMTDMALQTDEAQQVSFIMKLMVICSQWGSINKNKSVWQTDTTLHA